MTLLFICYTWASPETHLPHGCTEPLLYPKHEKGMAVKLDLNNIDDLSEAKLAAANHHLIQVESIHESMTTTVNTLYARLKTAKTRTSIAREALKASISADADCEADYTRARNLLDDAYAAIVTAEEDVWDLQDEMEKDDM